MSVLQRVLKNPEIDSEKIQYIHELVERAKAEIALFCRLPFFPEMRKGSFQSGSNPQTNLTGLDTNMFKISVNGSGRILVEINLEDCVDGDSTAAELQRAIRQEAETAPHYGFDEVDVAFVETSGDVSYFEIFSGWYGEQSSVLVSCDPAFKDVVRALRLSPLYGGQEIPGHSGDSEIETAAVVLVEQLYTELGIEGMRSGSIPGGISFSRFDFEPRLKQLVGSKRRLWRC